MRRLLNKFIAVIVLGLCSQISAAEKGATMPAANDQVMPLDEVGGVYCVIQDKPFHPSIYDLDIAGVSVRTYWKHIEPKKGEYNWSLFDGIVEKAAAAGMKARLCIMFGLGTPEWVDVPWFTGSADSEYDTADKPMPVPWHPNLIEAQKSINAAFAERYRDNPTVSFFHISGPSSIWEELALPKNVVDQEGYSQQAILDTWKQMIDQWKEIRGGKRLSVAASAATSVYKSLGEEIGYYAVGNPDDSNDHGVIGGENFIMQWNYLDTLYAKSVYERSQLWAPKTLFAWQYWASTKWPSRFCQDFEGTMRLGMNAGSLYVEVYDADLQDPALAPVAEQVNREMKEKIRRNGRPVQEIPASMPSSAPGNLGS